MYAAALANVCDVYQTLYISITKTHQLSFVYLHWIYLSNYVAQKLCFQSLISPWNHFLFPNLLQSTNQFLTSVVSQQPTSRIWNVLNYSTLKLASFFLINLTTKSWLPITNTCLKKKKTCKRNYIISYKIFYEDNEWKKMKNSYGWRVVVMALMKMMLLIILIIVGFIVTGGSWINEVFFIAKTCSWHIPFVLLPHFSNFWKIQWIIRHLSLLVPVPKLRHR